ncbi:MAG: isoprenylcysteine carboxylmethyltransferase family protein [Candidatus Omnitrophota bacterium]
MKKRIKIQGFLIFLAVVMLAAFHKYLLPGPDGSIAKIILDLIGLTLFLSGYFLRMAARGYKAQLNPDGKTLVTKGPYALTRNPMYLGTLLVGLGIIILILRWWWGSLIFLIIYLSIYIPQIRIEEKKLRDFFGGSFGDYCKNTPRFFPGIRSLMRLDSGIKFQLSWAKPELPSFLTAAAFVFLIKIWALLGK